MSSNKKRKANADDEDCITVEKCSFGVYYMRTVTGTSNLKLYPY